MFVFDVLFPESINDMHTQSNIHVENDNRMKQI